MCAVCGCGEQHPHPSGLPQARLVRLEQELLAKNHRYAEANRRHLAGRGIFALNLVSSPGSGKTTLLVKTIQLLAKELPMAVIGGDQQTDNDAQRLRATGVPVVQINTGQACHLDAHGVGHALEHLEIPQNGLLFIENVGNLVCPAGFDLGEAYKVVILSVTEGEDKPIKYPNMFAAASLMILNKIDLLPYLDFDLKRCIEYACRVNPHLQILPLSAHTGEGIEDWLAWLRRSHPSAGIRQE